MDNSYARHIAQAIRQKKAKPEDPVDELDLVAEETAAEAFEEAEPVADPKEKMRERIKAILAR